MPPFDLEGALARHPRFGGAFQGAIRREVSLAPLTHLRIGGRAEWLVEPVTESAVAAVYGLCAAEEVPVRILGGGSNLLVDDAGVRGVVISLERLNRIVRDDNRVTAGAGVSLATLMRQVRQVGLAGVELLCGIPAQVGGAVAMNAGTRDLETFDRLVSITTVGPDGRVQVDEPAAFPHRYRNGGLGDRVCVQATFELEPDHSETIFDRFKASLQRRNHTQPVTEHSVGCVFTNPEGDSAGRMIEAAGCKGMERGALQVSQLHANYFVNRGEGTSDEFLALLDDVKGRVAAEFGVELVPEVKFWGCAPQGA